MKTAETSAKNAGTQPRRYDLVERGGEQTDQCVGQTEKGAPNQEMKGVLEDYDKRRS